jgi:hypothetical protein
LEYLGVEGRIALKWFLKKSLRIMWTGFTWLRIGTRRRLL